MWNMRKEHRNVTDYTQKSYFCDNDAIYDVIMHEPVRKWRHNHRYEFRDSFDELLLFETYSIIFIFKQIDMANFAVHAPGSLILNYLEQNYCSYSTIGACFDKMELSNVLFYFNYARISIEKK